MIIQRCAGCGQELHTTWITALNRPWHENCFACAYCRKPIRAQSFLVKDQCAYHEDCHRLAFGKQCYVCGEYVKGRYLEDAWGSFCSEHRGKASCFGCGKIIAAEGGVQLDDGRAFCATCNRSAITTTDAARRHLPAAIGFLGRIGLPVRSNVELRFIAYEKSSDETKQLGITKTRITTSGTNGRVVSRGVEYIGVLSHLPVLQLQQTLAHELCHVWVFQQALKLSHTTEEGVAQLCAWLYLKEQAAGQLAEVIMRMIEENSDPVYGGGFRQAHHALSKVGMEYLIRHLVERGNLP